MKRCFDPKEPELMDVAKEITPELERDLKNLRRLNRWFGGTSLLNHFARRWLTPGKDPCWRILDLATGEGDLPRALVLWARQHGIMVQIDAVDFCQPTLEIARQRSPSFHEIRFHQGDLRNFGGGAPPWDFVLCSLALHHFSNEEAVMILKRARSLSRGGILVADLRRCWLGTLGVWLLTALILREPMTVHDARLSTRRAFSFTEFAAMATAAGWKNFGHRQFPWARQALWIDPSKSL